MKLRTVVNELMCKSTSVGREHLLDVDILLTPESRASMPSNTYLLRPCTYNDYISGKVTAARDEIVLAHSAEEIPTDTCPVGNVVAVTYEGSFHDFCRAFLELPPKLAVCELMRERIFETFLASYDLAHFVKGLNSVLQNPIIVANTELRVLASAGEFPTGESIDAAEIRGVLKSGYISEAVSRAFELDNVNHNIRLAKHSLLSTSSIHHNVWASAIIYSHNLELGRLDVLAYKHPISGFELELIDFASSLLGIMLDRLGAGGERAQAGSSLLADLLAGTFTDETSLYQQTSLLGIKRDMCYCLICVKGSIDADRPHYNKLGKIAARTVKGLLWSAQDDMLAILYPTGVNTATGFDAYHRTKRVLSAHKHFKSFIEHNQVRAFVSEPIENLLSVSARLAQCRALIASARDSWPPMVYFWEKRYAALAGAIGDIDHRDMLVDQRVLAMNRYDQEHGTNYFETMMASIRYPGSPQEAAESLSIHRNTYFYRVNKVRELFYLDYKNGDDRLALSFSAQVLEGMKLYRERL
ncbi:helix-turn-helix domain-containing protein [Collinsella sp. zg1085]|uniref:PucR family transcriptional regulator n=1 Tax=Collinsella sp. zg1085 TaxID=2844380 RepID=UPI001C0A9E9E|nr:PucR family transcriptional regulator [Collinsella sp. zg1085]QWT17679.1 helix-turn-helix domain-containing protein [Collinsella sp. zg1085]